MKLGAENSRKTALAVGLFVVALLLFFRTFAGGGNNVSPRSPVAASASVPQLPGAASAAAPARRSARSRQSKGKLQPSPEASLDPRLRLDLLAMAEQTNYTGAGRNIFRLQADPVIPKPVAPALRPEAVVPAQPPPPPPPPPINLKFFGFATSPGEAKRVFLAQGDDVFVAKEGDIVDRRYKIVHIGDQSIEVEDLLNNRRQTLPLTS